MDLENQKRVKEFAEQYGAENVVVILGAAEGEAAGLAAETVTAGDPTYAGPLTGVQLGLTTYHVCEPELKEEFDEAVYDEQVGMMEMVLDVDDIVSGITEDIEEATSEKADTTAVTQINDTLTAHTANTDIHVTTTDKSTWSGKQDQLVSGTNIKTINNQSLLGSGNINVQTLPTVEGTTLVFS